jgi:hypothetical protein
LGGSEVQGWEVQGSEVQGSGFIPAAGKKTVGQIEKETLKKRILQADKYRIMNIESSGGGQVLK